MMNVDVSMGGIIRSTCNEALANVTSTLASMVNSLADFADSGSSLVFRVAEAAQPVFERTIDIIPRIRSLFALSRAVKTFYRWRETKDSTDGFDAVHAAAMLIYCIALRGFDVTIKIYRSVDKPISYTVQQVALLTLRSFVAFLLLAGVYSQYKQLKRSCELRDLLEETKPGREKLVELQKLSAKADSFFERRIGIDDGKEVDELIETILSIKDENDCEIEAYRLVNALKGRVTKKIFSEKVLLIANTIDVVSMAIGLIFPPAGWGLFGLSLSCNIAIAVHDHRNLAIPLVKPLPPSTSNWQRIQEFFVKKDPILGAVEADASLQLHPSP